MLHQAPFNSGRHLAAARTLAGLTQSELAKLGGVHVNSLKRLERMLAIQGSEYSTGRIAEALKQVGVICECCPTTTVKLVESG